MSYTKPIGQQGSGITYKGTWTNVGGAILSGDGLDPASNVNGMGYGTFGNLSGRGNSIAADVGSDYIMRAGTSGLQGANFNWDKRLDASETNDASDGFSAYHDGSVIDGGTFDTGTSGSLGTGKTFRIVENGSNISANFKVYAKLITGDVNTIDPPSGDRIYVDPLNGKFLFPRPIFHSTLKSAAEIQTPLIKYGNTSPSISTIPFTVTDWIYWKFITDTTSLYNSTALYLYTRKDNRYSGWLYPFGSSGRPVLKSGTISFCTRQIIDSGGWTSTQIYIGNFAIEVCFRNYSRITSPALDPSTAPNPANGDFEQKSSTIFYPVSATWYHVYIVFDVNGGLTGGKSVRVFINGSEHLSTTRTFSAGEFQQIRIYSRCQTTNDNVTAESIYSYLKIWNHVVTESPTWEYSKLLPGKITTSIHSKYSASNDYKPVFTGASSGVGYLYIPVTQDTQSITTGSANQSVPKVSPNCPHANGYFSGTGPLSTSSYVRFSEDTDFAYGKRIDASTGDDSDDGFGVTSGGIWDPVDNINAGFTSGKYMRIINNAKNIKTAVGSGGLGLKIFAHNLGNFKSPPKDRCYVDPMTGKFSLPGPAFFSRMTDTNSITTPAIYEEKPSISTNGLETGTSVANISFVTGKFSNCLRFGYAYAEKYYTIYPFGESYIFTSTGCTVSFWHNVGIGGSTYINFSGKNNYVRITNSMVYLYISGSLVDSASVTTSTSFSHVYMDFDLTGTIGTTGKYARVIINGVEKVSTTSTWIPDYFSIKLVVDDSLDYIKMDNLKIWKHVVYNASSASDAAGWDYNSGSGRELSLHQIYGSSAGYRTVLSTTNSSGVGYYRKALDVDYVGITVRN